MCTAGSATWPRRISTGAIIDTPVSTTDILPTLAGAAGLMLPVDRAYDGVDLLDGAQVGAAATTRGDLRWRANWASALRRGDWKLVVTKPSKRHQIPDELVELFNIAGDGLEKNDLAAEYPGKVQELMARLDYYAEQAVTSLHDTAPQPTEEQKFPKIWGEFE